MAGVAGRPRGAAAAVGGRARGSWTLPAWLLLLGWAAGAGGAGGQRPLAFPAGVSNVAASGSGVLVASGRCWYEVSPGPAGRPRHDCPPTAAPSHNQLLLPFGRGRLLSCWTRPRGSCYAQRLPEGGQAAGAAEGFGEELVSYVPEGSAAGLMFRDGAASGWALAAATSHQVGPGEAEEAPPPSLARLAVFVLREGEAAVREDRQLALSGPQRLRFAEAFRWRRRLFFPFFHRNGSLEAKMLLLDEATFRHGSQALRCGGGGGRGARLLSAAFLEPRALWAGVFAFAPPDAATALCLFDLAALLGREEGCLLGGSEEFVSEHRPAKACVNIMWPINNSTSLSHFNLVSVYATLLLNKIVLFLGTGNGQLLKIILDDNLKPNCPEILYEIEEETPIFRKLELDPMDQDYIYLPSENTIRRIQVANCSKYISCRDCLSAMDPHCGWCYTKKSCTLKGECSFPSNSLNWANISYGTDKCLKIYTSQGKEDKVSVRVDVNSFGLSEERSRCTMLNARTNAILCDVTQRHMNCSCDLDIKDLRGKEEGNGKPYLPSLIGCNVLEITCQEEMWILYYAYGVQVSFISGTWHLSEIFEFNHCSSQTTCSECNHIGCTWNAREKKCVVSTATCARKIDCSGTINALSGKDHSPGSKPMKITSIEPNWISTLGKREVLVVGENFRNSNILMEITGTSSCQPDVGYLTEMLNDTHVKFCLPPSRKEVKSACVKENGLECSVSVPLHYVSFPSCAEILPNITWMSGGRNVTIRGKYLNITDTVIILGDLEQSVMQFTCHKNSFECSFATPAIKMEKDSKTVNMVLQVENTRIPCCELQYYPDPKFIYYELITELEPELELKIHKKKDNLNLSRNELDVFLSHMPDNQLINITFSVQNISKTATRTIIHCRSKQEKNIISKINKSSVKVFEHDSQSRTWVLLRSPNATVSWRFHKTLTSGTSVPMEPHSRCFVPSVLESADLLLARLWSAYDPAGSWNGLAFVPPTGTPYFPVEKNLSGFLLWNLVKVGNVVHEVPNESNYSFFYILLLIPIVIVVAFFVTQRKSKQLNRKLSEHLELLECELRKEIRDGFIELQVEELDVVDSFGTIPFLDYKHFVLRTFFPEATGTASIFIEDSNEPLSRDQGLYALICNKHFLVTLIHTLEKQKTFSVKDRCLFASFLTIALQTNLVYLTNILEVLTRDLMEQSSNIQPKLMLRRTESVVEKLLTNWMSVCLSGFLRETVGEPFYSLVTTLNQRIIKGPVDVITCKALYTLNEDWLLWQAPEFSTVVLNVVFENIQDEAQNIQVKVLDCDTVGQAKEKILQAFLNKNGSLYGLQLAEMGLTLESGLQAKELLDVDGSSVILENGITKLNTVGHYEISDGTTIKVFKKKQDLSADEEYSEDYCHLILPDAEAAKETQSAKHKGKQKFKVKEMYLTKLLSTKVAIHSTVEKLFRSIWTLPNNKAPAAIKYFFDFLDAQAENKKFTDPDVVHIWKTNSLPLRFWVNILKNPQFVFDIKKTPHIDGCLSVVAQAFMDAFSLSEQHLGKEAPTNKLLYAKDIPLYKEEVKAFYKAVRDLPSLPSSELEEFLILESQKHENEFNEAEALNKIYQYIARYFDKILNKLETERGLEDAREQLLSVKGLMDDKKKCKWA